MYADLSLSRYIYGIRILRDIHVGLYTYIPLSSPGLGAVFAAQGDPEPQRLPEVPIGLGRRGWYGEGRFHEAVKGRLVDLVGTPGH